jgi:hypothetical protein
MGGSLGGRKVDVVRPHRGVVNVNEGTLRVRVFI